MNNSRRQHQGPKKKKMAKLDPIRQLIKDKLDTIVTNFCKNCKESGYKYLSRLNLTVHYNKFSKVAKQTDKGFIFKYYIEGDDGINTDWYDQLDDALMAYVNKCEVGNKRYKSDKNKKHLKIGSAIKYGNKSLIKKGKYGTVRYNPNRNKQSSEVEVEICS